MQRQNELILDNKKYTIICNLGQGNFGFVLKVMDEAKNEFALKLLEKQDENEEMIIRKLQQHKPHRNIVNFIKSGRLDKQYYILMEYCDTDLYKQLQQKLIPQADLRYIMVSIADGLNHLHENNIIHRDLKPENVLVKMLKINDSQTQNIYKLGDFGCSSQNSIAQTQAIGTPYYMAPEVINGQSYDKSVDIWALGTIVYELLTGQPLFNGITAEDIYQLVTQQKDESPYIQEKLKILNNEYRPIVYKMLKVTPSLRPDIKEVIRVLRNNSYKTPPKDFCEAPSKIQPISKLKILADNKGYEANQKQTQQNLQNINKYIPQLNMNKIQVQNFDVGPKSARVVPTNTLLQQQDIVKNALPNKDAQIVNNQLTIQQQGGQNSFIQNNKFQLPQQSPPKFLPNKIINQNNNQEQPQTQQGNQKRQYSPQFPYPSIIQPSFTQNNPFNSVTQGNFKSPQNAEGNQHQKNIEQNGETTKNTIQNMNNKYIKDNNISQKNQDIKSNINVNQQQKYPQFHSPQAKNNGQNYFNCQPKKK